MQNNNIADISVFENIQEQANQSMGLSIFNDTMIENAIDVEQETNEITIKLKESWDKFKKEQKNLSDVKSKLKKAKKSNKSDEIQKAYDDYSLVRSHMIDHAESIENIQKRINALQKLPEVKKKPEKPPATID